MSFSLAILAGGKSKRLGFDKCTLTLNGVRIIDKILSEISHLFDDVLIVGENVATIGRIVKDLHPNRGPVAGLEAALFYAKNEAVFLIACDMPCVSREVVERELSFFEDQEVVCPFVDGKYQTAHAVYSKKIFKTVEKELERDKATLTHVILSAQKRLILVESDFKALPTFRESFLNVNFPRDMYEIQRVCLSRKSQDDIM